MYQEAIWGELLVRDDYVDFTLQRLVMEDCSDKVILELKPEGSDIISHGGLWEENIAQRTKAGLCLVRLLQGAPVS
jgi:hypothetical protein